MQHNAAFHQYVLQCNYNLTPLDIYNRLTQVYFFKPGERIHWYYWLRPIKYSARRNISVSDRAISVTLNYFSITGNLWFGVGVGILTLFYKI